MKVAVVGCGSIGRRHLRNALALGHEVVAHDLNHGLLSLWTGDWTGRLSFAPALGGLLPADAVLICTPAHTHGLIATRLQDAGYGGPLFVEKPLDVSVENCAVFRSWPSVVQVGYNWRFHPDMRAFRADARARGSRCLLFWCHTRIDRWPGFEYQEPILECSHEIDLCVWLGADRIADASQSGSAWSATMNDGELRCSVDWNREPDRGATCYVDGMHYEVGFSADRVAIALSYRRELESFLRASASGVSDPEACSAAQGITVLQFIDDARRLAGVTA